MVVTKRGLYDIYKIFISSAFTMETTMEPWAPRFEEFLAQSHYKAIFLTAILLTLILFYYSFKVLL